MIAAKPPYTSTSGQVPSVHLVREDDGSRGTTLCGLSFTTDPRDPGSLWDSVPDWQLAAARERGRVCGRCARCES